MPKLKRENAQPYSSVEVWDLVEGLLSWRLWAFLGLQDIQQRYRRSAFGPLWLALGLGVTVFGIGLLYSQILKTATGSYIPYIAISLFVWNFISAVMIESTSTFTGAVSVITAVKLPYSSFILRTIARNVIVAAHSLVVVFIAYIWARYPVTWVALMSIVGALLVIANLYWMSMLIAMLSARYRDVSQIIIYLVGIALFLTPIIWMPTVLRPQSPYLVFNPLAQMVEVIRAPVFEHRVPMFSLLYIAAALPVGLLTSSFAFIRWRRRIVHWM